MFRSILLPLILICNTTVYASVNVVSYRGDATSTNVTLYQNSMANIVEKRTVSISPQTQTIAFENILGKYDQEFDITGKNILYINIPNPNQTYNFLERYEGKQVTVTLEGKNGQVKKKGTLIKAFDIGKYAIKFGETLTIIPEKGIIEIENADVSGLQTVTIGINPIKANSKEEFTLNYNVDSLSWRPVYKIEIPSTFENKSKITISGDILITNTGNDRIENCQLTLLAGETAQTPQPPRRMLAMQAVMAKSTMEDSIASTPLINAESYQNRWVFNLPYKYTINENSTTKIPFFESHAVIATKEYKLSSFVETYSNNNPQNLMPSIGISFKNNTQIKETSIGLLQGNVKVFDAAQGKLLANNHIEDIAPNGEIKVNIGQDYTAPAKRQQTNFELNKDKGIITIGYAITVENQSSEGKTIVVEENFGNNEFKIQKSNIKYTQEGSAVKWNLELKPNEKKEIIYTATVRQM